MLVYKPENVGAPWVCLVGKHCSIWIAYPTRELALANFPRLLEGFKNHG